MTAASSICRIRLSCSTTVSTSNWKALAIASSLLAAIFLISRSDDTIGFRPNGNEANASTVAVFTETEGGLISGKPGNVAPERIRGGVLRPVCLSLSQPFIDDLPQ